MQQLAYLDISDVSDGLQHHTCVHCMGPHGSKCCCQVGLLGSTAGARVALKGMTCWYMHLGCHLVHNHHRNPEGLC